MIELAMPCLVVGAYALAIRDLTRRVVPVVARVATVPTRLVHETRAVGVGVPLDYVREYQADTRSAFKRWELERKAYHVVLNQVLSPMAAREVIKSIEHDVNQETEP